MEYSDGFSGFAQMYKWAFYLWNYNFNIYGYDISFFELFLFGVVAWGIMKVIWSAVDARRS